MVSVLFADLVGFTPFAEERDAEEVRETLSRYFELAEQVVLRYGGTVEKFIGDAVMALWGAPTAHEDDAERAVRAGLELVDVVRGLGDGIAVRAGILTGEAAVTLGATNQGLVAGDLVNTAARLQSVAPAGAVLVGEATRRAASQAIAFEAFGAQELKGKASPVPAFRALRVVAERGGRNRSESLEAPFVGRDEELRLLKDLFHATSRERRIRLVSVIGPAGIGKSRLAWEFLKYLDGLSERVWWHDGRSPAYGDGISFWALGEMVRGRCGLLEADDEPTTRTKVGAALAEHIPDEAERQWIEPALLALLGIESQIASEQLFGAWRTFFERLAASSPVVMVFEDFHHADAGLLDFIDHLLEWSRNVPITILTLARPALLEKRADWGAGTRNFTNIHLEPLAEQHMRTLLAGLVPGLPEAAMSAIVARADGVPLYAVETVRMLVSEGKLKPTEDGTYRPSGELTSFAVPETLTALIGARLDALAAEDRALVSDAAVLGQSFTLAGLAAVSGIDEAELGPRLRALVRRELLSLEADPRSPERGQYAFVQALIREVAYNTLARRDRKVRHLAAARFFESLGSDELAGGLAAQYLAAYQNAPAGAEADALGGQARRSLRAASDRAAALGSHDQAVRFLEQALSITADPLEQADLLERAGASASAAAHHHDAQDYLTRALDLRRQGTDRAAIARAATELATSLLNARQNDAAMAILESSVAEFADLGPDAALVGLRAQLGRAYMLREDSVRSIEVIDQSLDAAEHGDIVAVLADALVTKGTSLTALGRFHEGLAVIEAGERLARANDQTPTALRGLNNRLVSLPMFDPPASLAAARDGLALARRIGAGSWVYQLIEKVIALSWLTGAWDDALAEARAALDLNPEPGDKLALLYTMLQIGAARGEAVEELHAELGRTAREVTDPQVLWMTVDAAALTLFAAGRLSVAGETWREGARRFKLKDHEWLYMAAMTALLDADEGAARADLAALDALELRAPLVASRLSTIQAGVAALAGQAGEAVRYFEAGLRGLRALEVPYNEAMAATVMATLLDPASPPVRVAVDRAREILLSLGARPLLDRLEAARRPRPSRDDAARTARSTAAVAIETER